MAEIRFKVSDSEDLISEIVFAFVLAHIADLSSWAIAITMGIRFTVVAFSVCNYLLHF
jgi:hypothetical protein